VGGVGASRVPGYENPISLHRIGECRQRATGWILAAGAFLLLLFFSPRKEKEGCSCDESQKGSTFSPEKVEIHH